MENNNVSSKNGEVQAENSTFIIDEEVLRKFSNDYRVLPLCEQKMFNYKLKFEHSLERNHKLGRRWKEYVSRWGVKREPYMFPKIGDYHFYKSQTVYRPSDSTSNRTDFRMKLRPGPGVDDVGQKPIPDELHVIRHALPQVRRQKGGLQIKMRK